MENKLIVLVGLPGSGKSHLAQEIAKKEQATILSSDDIREELFGDASKQKKTAIVYETLYERAKSLLLSGKNVVIDATNIDRNKRVKALKKFQNIKKECHYLDTPYEECLLRNQMRKRKVDPLILFKMRKFLQIPTLSEGWEVIQLHHFNKPYPITRREFEKLIIGEPTYQDIFGGLSKITFFKEMDNYNQDSPFHSHTLCLHTYKVFEYLNQNYLEADKLLMQIVALFHDTGKPFCQIYKPGKDHASYFAHEHVSAQNACHFLKELGYDDVFIFKAVHLIEMHMLITYGGEEGATQIYHLLGEDALTKLYIFKEADFLAK
jgi:predicted kinase